MYDVVSASAADEGCGPNMQQTGIVSTPLRQQVFEHVRGLGRVARSDISRGLGISAGSISAVTADLIGAGLLREVETPAREPGRGRPPVALEVVADSHLVIGVKLGDERHSAVLSDFAGRQLAEATLPTTAKRKTVNQLMDELASLCDTLLAPTGLTMSQIAGVGVGVSGIVDSQTGTIAWSPLLRERDVPMAARLTERFGVPMFLDNDANMLTLNELWFGAGRSLPDFVVITVEHGVGMGVVLGNRLFRGSRGMGLELGHIKVQLDGALCRCGQRGCLEAYLADYALAREAVTALDAPVTDTRPAVIMQMLLDEAKAGNAGARAIFRRAGRYLSLGLANVIQLFDPALIILTGDRMQYDYLYADEMLAETRALTLSEGRMPCRVAAHAWGDLVWAKGATALALSAVTAEVVGLGRNA